MVIGEIILSAFLQALFTKLLEVKFFAANLEKEVDSLSATMATILVVLDNAEKRQNEDPIKTWLQNLRNVVYKANDLIDEVAYEDLRRQHVKFPKVRNSLSVINPRRLWIESTLCDRIIEIQGSLDRIVRHSSVLRLRGAPENRQLIARTMSESSSVGYDTVFGRVSDANIILASLLSDDFCKDNVNFISICGKAGLGKTTLAQVAFNDVSLAGYFHPKIWVHASSLLDNDAVNVRAIIKATIESATGTSCDLPNLNAMQHKLWQLLEQKRYLLVLDAMLNDEGGFLDMLKNILMGVGANGSKVLITTPKRSISKLLNIAHTHELEPLSKDNCQDIIRKYAFYDRNRSSYPDLNRIVGKIAYKCNGLPSAAKKYGMLLMAETERERWELISQKEIGEILESDYDVSQNLPGNMKRCFAYCCIFPHKFIFDKEQLVQQWLAQDFVPTEEKGREYFDLMFRWSLFHYSPSDDNVTQIMYVMDDDIRSKAQSIAGEECLAVHRGNSHKISEVARHASFICSSAESRGQIMDHFHHLLKAKGLYTLHLLARMQFPEIVTKLRCLRTLDLSNTDLHELPDSIADLKHLRYLSLHNTRIKRLNNFLSELYHLQTLGLRNCPELTELPKDMRCLTNLRHLDLHLDHDSTKHGGLKSMPWKMGKLRNLRTLSRFVVSKDSRCGVSELADMNDLHGSIILLCLQFVNSPEEALKARLELKEHLQMLDYRWDVDGQNSSTDTTVLDHLCPHTNIRELKIEGFRGHTLSSWIGNPSFSSLVMMKIYNCQNLSRLPPLSLLPSLKKLHVESLPNWSDWCEAKLPSLRELIVRNCTSLRSRCAPLPVLMLVSLRNLELSYCLNLAFMPRGEFPRGLQTLNINECPKLIRCFEQDWDAISCIPSVWINGHLMCSSSGGGNSRASTSQGRYPHYS